MNNKSSNLSKLFNYYKKYKLLSIMVIVLSFGYAGISHYYRQYMKAKCLDILKISIKIKY